MPIETATRIHWLGREEFHALDRKLMGIVFDVLNCKSRGDAMILPFFDQSQTVLHWNHGIQ